MFDKLGDMGGMLKKVYEMKKDMEKIKEELNRAEVKGTFGSSIEVTATGDMKIKSIKIDPKTLSQGDSEKLEDMMLIAVNKALDEAKDLAKNKMAAIAGGINIPGLF